LGGQSESPAVPLGFATRVRLPAQGDRPGVGISSRSARLCDSLGDDTDRRIGESESPAVPLGFATRWGSPAVHQRHLVGISSRSARLCDEHMRGSTALLGAGRNLQPFRSALRRGPRRGTADALPRVGISSRSARLRDSNRRSRHSCGSSVGISSRSARLCDGSRFSLALTCVDADQREHLSSGLLWSCLRGDLAAPKGSLTRARVVTRDGSGT
jgi:hypothetical protein